MRLLDAMLCCGLLVFSAACTKDAADATDTTDDATDAADDVTETADEVTDEATDEVTDEVTDETEDATDATDETVVEDNGIDEEVTWGLECSDDAECPSPTNMCAKQPGAPTGYCSTQCGSTQECHDSGAPTESWTCNAVSCSIPAMTWCGPNSEIEESGGFLSVCE